MWILAIALPVQGVYAGTLRHCVGGDHRTAFEAASSLVHPHAEAPGSEVHGMHAAHVHLAMHPHVEPSSSSHSHQGTGPNGSCSACAACCSSTAPPPALLALVAQKAEHAVPAFVSFAVVTFVTDGPERPPRTALG